jgi:hypothetical protein
MRYKNPTPNPLPASDEGAKMYLIGAETAVCVKILVSFNKYTFIIYYIELSSKTDYANYIHRKIHKN